MKNIEEKTGASKRSKRRELSPAARARIVAQIKARWAKVRQKQQKRKTAAAPAVKQAATTASSPQERPKGIRKTPGGNGKGDASTGFFTRGPGSIAVGSLDAPDVDAAAAHVRGNVIDFDPATCMRSPFNREIDTKSPAFLELLDKIRERGVLQNGIVRTAKNPANPKIKWEIIAGERRWLCAGLAKVVFPARVYECDDTTAIEIQAMENMDRENLNPIDEATKYEQLRQCYEQAGLNKAQAMDRIEAKTGSSEAIIYERLALLRLPAKVQDLVGAGKGQLSASVAGLLPKVNDPKTIEKIAAWTIKGENGEPRTYREVKEEVGYAAQCEKNLADWQRQKQEFEGKGWVVLSPTECARSVGAHRRGTHFWFKNDASKNYIKPDDCCDIRGANSRHWDKLWKKAPAPTLARCPDGRPVIIYLREGAEQAVREAGRLEKPNKISRAKSPEELVEEERQRERETDFQGAMTAILDHVSAKGEGAEIWGLIVWLVTDGYYYHNQMKTVATRRGWEGADSRSVIREKAKGMGAAQLRSLALEILLIGEAPNRYIGKWEDGISLAARLCAVKLPPWDKSRAPGKASKEEKI